MSRINTSKTDISSDCRTVQVLVIVWAAVSFQDICDIKPRTRRDTVVVVAVGHTGQGPGTLSVVGYGTGQGTQNVEPGVASRLHGIRSIAGRERPVVAVAGATVIAVGRAGLRSHLACNERSREHRCRTTRTNTDGEALCFWSVARVVLWVNDHRKTTLRQADDDVRIIRHRSQHQNSSADVICWWRTSSRSGWRESTWNCAQKTKRDGMRTNTKKN